MEVTGQAVAQLTHQQQSQPDSPFRPRQTTHTHQKLGSTSPGATHHPRTSGGSHYDGPTLSHNVIRKIPFPTFLLVNIPAFERINA